MTDMAGEKVFQDEDDLKDWLLSRGVFTANEVVGETVDDVASILWNQGNNAPSTLYGITSEEVHHAGVKSRPMCRLVSNKLKQTETTWYQVKGAVSRPSISHASAARLKLFRFASAENGLYEEGCDSDSSFEAFELSGKKTVLKFSVIFRSLDEAGRFVDNLAFYLKQQTKSWISQFCDDEGNKVGRLPAVTPIAPFPITPENKILEAHHYTSSSSEDKAAAAPAFDGEASVRFDTGSELIMNDEPNILEMEDDEEENSGGSVEGTIYDGTVLSKRNEVFRYQRIEHSLAFALSDAEAAYIFPNANCVGDYEWLTDKPYNRIALSRDLLLNYCDDVSVPGRKKNTVQNFAIRPIRAEGGYSIAQNIVSHDNNVVECYEIPLEIVVNDKVKAEAILARLPKLAKLHNKNYEIRYWTITGLWLLYPTNRKVDLVAKRGESTSWPTELETAIPGVYDLNDCWSFETNDNDSLTLEAAEILEKCLCWNYDAALESWAKKS